MTSKRPDLKAPFLTSIIVCDDARTYVTEENSQVALTFIFQDKTCNSSHIIFCNFNGLARSGKKNAHKIF